MSTAEAAALNHPLTPEEQLLLDQGMDPALLAESAPLDLVPLGPDGQPPYNPYEVPLPGPELPTQQIAEQNLRQAETKAIENARKNGTPNAAAAADKVSQDRDVAAAREAVEGAYGSGLAAKQETSILEEAITNSGFADKSAAKIADEVSHGKSAEQAVTTEVPVGAVSDSRKATEQLAALEDAYNGGTDALLRPTAKRAKADLRSLGISERIGDLKARIAEISGTRITTQNETKRAEQQIVGEDVIEGLASNSNRLSGKKRTDLIERLKEDGILADIAEEVAHRRRGGEIGRQAARRAGKLLVASSQRAA